jgi:hypothetical protein
VSSSSINTVIPALVTLLQARPNLATVSVIEGPAEPSVRNREELILVLDAKGQQSVRAINATTQPRNEEYDVAVLISVLGETRNDQATLRARCFALMAEIEAQLRSDVHLGLVGVYASVVGHISYTARLISDSTRESAIDFDIHVTARL